MSTGTISLERPAAPVASVEDLDARRALAFDANFEIEMLAKGMKQLMETERDEETAKLLGMLSRIQLLSSIVFFAARLHGSADPDHDWAQNDSLETLRLAFDGRLT
jgi:hypothetical protein